MELMTLDMVHIDAHIIHISLFLFHSFAFSLFMNVCVFFRHLVETKQLNANEIFPPKRCSCMH